MIIIDSIKSLNAGRWDEDGWMRILQLKRKAGLVALLFNKLNLAKFNK